VNAAQPLNPTICREPCVEQVCQMQPSCCGGPNFDEACQDLAAELCPDGNECIKAICNQLPDCCTVGWTQACAFQAVLLCNTQCNCQHSICSQGSALPASCNPCAAAVCKVDDFCCTGGWDATCVQDVAAVCGIDCDPNN
jgi:hypothetical protein